MLLINLITQTYLADAVLIKISWKNRVCSSFVYDSLYNLIIILLARKTPRFTEITKNHAGDQGRSIFFDLSKYKIVKFLAFFAVWSCWRKKKKEKRKKKLLLFAQVKQTSNEGLILRLSSTPVLDQVFEVSDFMKTLSSITRMSESTSRKLCK